MASLNLFLATALVVVSAAYAEIEFYKPVEGKCSDLMNIRAGTERQVPPGDWYFPYSTLSGRCGGAYALIRPLQNLGFGDIRIIEEGNGDKYTFFPNDVVFQPEKNYTYEALNGGISQVLMTEEDNYCFFVQCQDAGNGKSLLGIMFGLREPVMNKVAEDAYKKFSGLMREKNLLPETVFELKMDGCPRYHTIKFGGA